MSTSKNTSQAKSNSTPGLNDNKNVLAAEEGRSNLLKGEQNPNYQSNLDLNAALDNVAQDASLVVNTNNNGFKQRSFGQTLKGLLPFGSSSSRNFSSETQPLLGGNVNVSEQESSGIIPISIPKITIPPGVTAFFTKYKTYFYVLAVVLSVLVGVVLYLTGNTIDFTAYVKAAVCYFFGKSPYLVGYCAGEPTKPTPLPTPSGLPTSGLPTSLPTLFLS